MKTLYCMVNSTLASAPNPMQRDDGTAAKAKSVPRIVGNKGVTVRVYVQV